MKKIKQIRVLFGLIVSIVLLGLPGNVLGQSNGKDFAEIYVYRANQNMFNGKNPLEVKITMNNKEIGLLQNGTKLKYKVYSKGSIKIKCFLAYSEGSVGKPYYKTIDVENGKEYHVSLKTVSLTGPGVAGKLLDEKGISKITKKKFYDESEYVEDKSNPIIKENI